MHRRLISLTRDARLPLLLTILAGLLAGLLTIGQSYALSSTVNAVFLQHQALLEVWPWMRLLLAIIAGRTVLVWLNEVSASAVAVRVKTDLRERLFAHILALGPAYTRGERTGDLTTAAVDGIEALDAYFSQYLPQLVVSSLVPITILFLVFPLDPLSGLVLLLTAPLIPFFMYLIGRGAEAVTKRQYETLSRLSAHFLDSLQGLTTLKLFGQARAQARNIARVNDQYRDTTLKVLQITFLSAFALELLATISTAIIAVEVGLRLLYGQMQFQEALFLLILAPEFYLPLRMLGLRFHAGMAGTSAARRIFQILDTPVSTPSGLAGETISQGNLPGQPAFSSLALTNVGYAYPGESAPALQNVSLTLGASQHVALVGASGAGKTTLSNLLLRFMQPTGGVISLDGRPAGDVPVGQWRELIAWLPQNPYLFHDTIAANIRIGRPEASDAEVASAARSAHLEDYIDSLPEKYQTVVGEAGARLSGGQAQRLALARAFLKDAPILIMDEPTSSLDPETESLLEESTRKLMQGRSVLTIAHRLNTVARADHIVVLEAGRAVEQGTHAELLAQNGAYARTIQVQRVGVRSVEADRAEESPSSRGGSGGDVLAAPPRPGLEAAPAGDGTSVFRRLLMFLQGSWGWVALSVILGALTIGSSVALMGTSSWLISTAALRPSIAALEVAVVGVRFFGIARAVFRYLERLVSHNVTFRLLGRLRTWFYERLEPLAPARLMDYRAGDLLARIIGEVSMLENFYVRVLAPPIVAVLVGIGTAVFLGASDPRLSAILVLTFLLLGAVLPLLVQHASVRDGAEVVRQRADLQVQLVDSLQGLPDLLAFNRAGTRMSQLRNSGAAYGESQRRMAAISGLHAALFSLGTSLAPWLVLLLAIPQVDSGRIPGVMLATLVLVTSASFEAVSPLPVAAQTWSSTRAAARRLFEVVDTVPEVTEPARMPSSGFVQPRAGSTLEVSNVSFSYPGQAASALQAVSFRLEPGEKLAIVGPSGAGKSTLASLVLRFWEFSQGDICIDGRSIRSLPSDEVRQKIALVSSHTYFFNSSIYENLRMARRGVSREQVEAAAQAAQIHDVIVKLPKGYDTLIGERGLRLSGGERQRLAIARAILKDAPIFILDEPTANLDAINEAEILSALFRLMQGKASLLITHRLIGLDRVDRILVMERGRIVEQGSEAELLALKGSYFRLWENQNRLLLGP